MKLSILIFAVALACLAGAPPAAAASALTDGFLANLRANTSFLEAASRLATERSASAPMRAFANAEAGEQVKVADALENLAPSVTVASTDGEVATGRSAAVDAPFFVKAVPTAVKPAANGRSALGEEELANLRTLNGKAFDDLYWRDQLDALSQIESDYRTYIRHGDDSVLVALARRELPVLMARLKALTKI